MSHALATNEDIATLALRVEALEQKFAERQRLSRGNLTVIKAKEGIMLVRKGDLVSDWLIERGTWDEHIVDVVDLLPANRRRFAVDVGGHFGAVSIMLAKRFSWIAAFEPNDFSYNMLAANVAINGLHNVTLFNHGLYASDVQLSLGSASQQEIVFPVDENGNFDALATPNIASYAFTLNGSGEFSRPAKPLDAFKFDNLDFIKIDVQGADGEVIRGAQNTIERCNPVIVFEWEEELSKNFSTNFAQVEGMLHRAGYLIEVLHKHNEKQVDFIAKPSWFA